MLNGNYVSIARVIERLYRDSIIFRELNISEYDIAEYVGSALLKIGAKPQYQDNFALIEIKDYRGILPCAPTSIESIRNGKTGIGTRSSTDTFSGSPNRKQNRYEPLNQNPYTIKGSIIHVDNMQEGQLEIKYQSLVTDDLGLPMIPDDERYFSAIESYVKYKAYRPLWEIGQIRDVVYREAESDWLFYVNSAKTKALMPNVDGMESVKNNVVKLLRDYNTRNNTGRDVGQQEMRKTYNSK